jgi:enoyl-CoA hydratase/carnithine racemase
MRLPAKDRKPMTDKADVRVTFSEVGGGRVATVTLDRAAKLNTLNSQLMGLFVDAMEALEKDDDLRAIVLRGAGERAFVGGADVDELATLTTPDEGRTFIRRVHWCCRAVREAPVPVIARLSGWCLGAGLELAAACDLRVAAKTAQFGMPETRLGIPSVVEAALLPRLIGFGRAREILLWGETFSAEAAAQWGLVEHVTEDAELDAVVSARLEALMGAAPTAVRLQKRLVRQWEDLTVSDGVQAGVEAFAEAFETDEPGRVIGAFLQAREARRAAKA